LLPVQWSDNESATEGIYFEQKAELLILIHLWFCPSSSLFS
jgi:hypothetical protein